MDKVPIKRLVVMAHWDPDGRIAGHVRYCVEALRSIADDFVFVSAAELRDEDLGWAEARTRVIVRPNRGYDFASYKLGLEMSQLGAFDEVVILNDSMIFPLIAPASIFEFMRHQAADFWGLTTNDEITPHVQSFFLVFSRPVVASESFRAFWQGVGEENQRGEVISRYEVGLSQSLSAAGFSMGRYFVPTPKDKVIAAVRTAYRHLPQVAKSLRPQTFVGELSRLPSRLSHWNVTIALADTVLEGGRLPLVKIETLRFDPNRLGGRLLLSYCEQAFPLAFTGVRTYLERTDQAYGGRWALAHKTPPWLPHYRQPRARWGRRSRNIPFRG